MTFVSSSASWTDRLHRRDRVGRERGSLGRERAWSSWSWRRRTRLWSWRQYYRTERVRLRRWRGTRNRVRWQEQRTDIPTLAGPRRVPPVRRYPLQIRDVGLRHGLRRRGVIDDLSLVRGDRVDPMHHDGRVIHHQAPQHRSHPLAADLGSLVVVRLAGGVEVGADELHRVAELRQAQQTVRGALGRVVDVVEIRHRVREDVQNLLDVVALV